ncbi:oligosaccharide flippase family protein [Vibrio alfacsensis]|uniref:oligosaccharide flippase family protein n=1 Tax=Vibrio alfacsensis TaxID=1074311 RepID=UPI00406810E8
MDLVRNLTKSYAWLLFGRWGMRFIGIGSTLFLVRLLPPEAFGIVATATIYIGLFDTLSEVGVKRYLIAHTDLSDRDLNTAWTYRVVVKFLLTIMLILSAGFIAVFVNNPELRSVIIIISISGFIGALGNIGLVRLEKAVNYKPMVRLSMVVKVITAIITVAIAYYNQTYWALVIGSLIGSMVHVVGTYIVYQYVPRFDWKFDKAMVNNSGWLLLRAILGYLRNRFDILLASNIFSSTQVGQYKIAQDFSVLPFSEVIGPAIWGMFPALSHLKHDRERLYLNTYKFLAFAYLLIIPSVFGTFMVSEQFTLVVLGEQWVPVIPILGPLSMMMIGYPLRTLSNNIYDYQGKTNISAILDAISLLTIAVIFISAHFMNMVDNLHQFVVLRVFVFAFIFIFTIVFVKMTLGLSLLAVSSVIMVPLVASIMMYIGFTIGYVSLDNTLVGLFINVVLGIIYYASSVISLIYFASKKSIIWKYWMVKIQVSVSNLLIHWNKLLIHSTRK